VRKERTPRRVEPDREMVVSPLQRASTARAERRDIGEVRDEYTHRKSQTPRRLHHREIELIDKSPSARRPHGSSGGGPVDLELSKKAIERGRLPPEIRSRILESVDTGTDVVLKFERRR
jgi:hypothetical protein